MSRVADSIAEVARHLRPEGIASYLSRRGWTAIPGRRPEIRRYAPPGGSNGFALLTPAITDLDDYDKVVTRLVEILSKLEDRSAFDVVAQMLEPCDVVRAQVVSSETRDGSIPLPKAMQLVQGMHDLVVQAALAELPPSPKRNKEAVELANRSRFGQTDVGSFIATLYYPVSLADLGGQVTLPGTRFPAPIHRRITARLVRGLGYVARAAENGDVELLGQHADDGLNSEMCQAVSQLVSSFPQGACSFSANFDPIVAVPADLPVSQITIPATASLVLDRAATLIRRAARPQLPEAEPREVWVEGYVTQLQHVHEDREDVQRPYRVWVLWDTGDTPRTVSFDVSPDVYNEALEAHRRTVPIRVRGRLDGSGSRPVLLNPHDFQLDERQVRSW